MSHETEVARANDDTIIFAVETDLGRYYRLGNRITVRYSGRGFWLCLTCTGADRWQNADHKGCCHIERVERWVDDNEVPAAA